MKPELERIPKSVKRFSDSNARKSKISERRSDSVRSENALKLILSVGSPLLLLIVWQAVTAFKLFPPEVLVSPTAVVSAFGEVITTGELQRHLSESLTRLAGGFTAGASLGLLFGLALALSKTVERVFGPTFQALRQVPVLAFIPMLILLLGIDEVFKIIIIAKAAFFPVALAAYDSVKGVPKSYFEVSSLYRAPWWVLISKILIPATIPNILAGVRLSLTRSWLVLVAAELIVADSGLGQMMEMGRQMFRLDIVMVGVIVAGVIGFGLDRLFQLLQAHALRWKTA
ncbi:ABC transporter permease [Asticcacaulis sp. ZE23SCel15]|uniref:ABC transporter permease n=1 Tax=Asticcacaulis sp. ZE23SCel15 TaxID=3059027 RepID=UPI00265E9CDE|nr:ABC transporter permease [Asticcacaulis sp. ZE23SCel15]WKL56741.1 ABC transporter permease [Asticcacaulis sp. ZE23SCel15]